LQEIGGRKQAQEKQQFSGEGNYTTTLRVIFSSFSAVAKTRTTPLARERMFSAVRSPISRLRTGPSTVATATLQGSFLPQFQQGDGRAGGNSIDSRHSDFAGFLFAAISTR
jgi:hypothetical protein